MKTRVLAMGLALAWPSFAHAGWIYDTIGAPITGGLSDGYHAFHDSMATGAKETRSAFGMAPRQGNGNWAGVTRQELSFDPNSDAIADKAQWDGYGWRKCQPSGCFDGEATPLPYEGDRMAPSVPLRSVAEPTLKATIYNNSSSARVIEIYDAKTGAWTHRLAVQPGQKTEVLLHRGEDGRAGAVLRWDHDPRFDVLYGRVNPGDELR